ncbi:MAG: hypothetical protein ABID61_06615 [Candidatus Micrarchaeota archaeon]
MRWFFVLIPLILLGCTGTDSPATNTLEPAPSPIIQEPKVWESYSNSLFSFDYPGNMVIDEQPGFIRGIHYLPDPNDNQLGESLLVIYVNTSEKYGPNQDDIFKFNPTKTATDFLLNDKENDSMGVLSHAHNFGTMRQFTVAKKYYVAEIPFKLSDFNTTSDGYAMSIYIPESSTHLNVRISAFDPKLSYNMKEAILRSLRLE